jgi:gluconate 5-dehydrogenase
VKSSAFDLSGKVVLVTGASRGLGRGFAAALAGAGADLAVTSRTVESLAEIRREVEALGRRCLPVALEVRSHASVTAAVAAVIAHFGRIDVLVNNAGLNIRKPTVDVTPEDWDTVLETNLRGAFLVAQTVGRHMLARAGGRIINIGSITSVRGISGIAAYSASRGGIKQMTMSLAEEWGPRGVTVNCLAPGWFKTAQNAFMFEDRDWRQRLESRIPLGRSGQPEDLAGPVIFLASDASAYVTGQTLLVDGGFSLGGLSAAPAKARPASAPG